MFRQSVLIKNIGRGLVIKPRPFVAAAFMSTSKSTGKVPSLVSPDWLRQSLGKDKLAILDGSWHMPNVPRNAKQEYLAKHIPGAQFFGIDEVKDTSTDLPHMLPPTEEFEKAVGHMGIDQKDHVVVYDSTGVFSACRVYWTFKAFGHENISVLNGGLIKWEEEGGELAEGEEKVKPKKYKATRHPELVREYAQMLENSRAVQQDQPSFQVVDSRPADRFTGESAEPRPGIRSGHMPGSISIPFSKLINPKTHEMLEPGECIKVFEEAGVDLSQEVVASCGSGITASVLYMALERAGAQNIAVYDGSWTEYGSKADSIIIQG